MGDAKVLSAMNAKQRRAWKRRYLPRERKQMDESSIMQIVITLGADGRVKVTAPFDDKIGCFGLLEAAKIVISNMRPTTSNLVQPANSVAMAALAGMSGPGQT